MESETGGRLPFLEWGVTTRAMPGQTVSGDQYVVLPRPTGVLLAVIDGLGHGHDAASAAQAAVETLRRYAQEPPIPLIQHCHQALRSPMGW